LAACGTGTLSTIATIVGLIPMALGVGEALSNAVSAHAEQLAKLLHMNLDDRAFGVAEASDASPPLLVDPATGNPLPINLPEQIAGYLAGLDGHKAPHDTTALINIGSNDYDAFFFLGLDPQTIQAYVTNVVGSIEQAVDALTQAGLEVLWDDRVSGLAELEISRIALANERRQPPRRNIRGRHAVHSR